MLTKIDGTLRDYPWGVRGGVSALLGRAVGPAEGVEAEYWLSGGGVLLKVLCAGEPLSLQVHPNAVLARAGFAREQASGLSVDDPHRSFRDEAGKAEMLLAVSDEFEALVGFRFVDDTAAAVRRLAEGLRGAAAVDELLGVVAREGVAGAFLWLVTGTAPARACAEGLLDVVARHPDEHPVQARLAALHPGDPGAIASLLLNHVVLRRGEALAVEPGTIHAYLRGTGIEVMVESDNVLRAGLTGKHVDLERLAEALTRTPAPPVRPETVDLPGGVEHRFRFADGALALAVVSSDATLPTADAAVGLVLAGRFTVRTGESSIDVGAGEAFRASGDAPIAFSGAGSLVLAR